MMTIQTPAFLHVKWFIDPETGASLPLWAIISKPGFLFWLGVTLFGLLITAIFNDKLQRIPFIEKIHHTLDRAKPYLPEILRYGLGIGLLLQLASSTYLAPELHGDQWWIKMLIIGAVLGLILRKSLFISGLSLGALYNMGIKEHGLFQMLDYSFYIGIIYFLMVANTRWKSTATPVLYLFTGFALAWVAFEKFTMPGLAVSIVQEYGIPTFGFSTEDFVLISAFIEIGLAWSFIVGILNRFVSIVVTMVFLTTTTVFGFTEIIGHTIVHTLLIMFIIEGEGTFKTPFQFHRSPVLRCSFVLVNFCVLLFAGLWAYTVFLG